MKAHSDSSSYADWRQAQEWIGEWLLAHAQGRNAIPPGAAIRLALGLGARAKDREVEAKLRALAAAPVPKKGDAHCTTEGLTRIRAILAGMEEDGEEAESAFLCAFCGQPTPLEVDPEDGSTQSMTVDCSVCCRPNVIRLSLAPDGAPRAIEALPEQD